MSIADDALDFVPGGAKTNLGRLPQKGFGHLLRVTIMLVVCIAVIAMALVFWWLSSWNQDGLPDIGDAEEIAAVRALGAGVDRNAFTSLQGNWPS
jgi:hypothetical protein